MDVTNGFSGRVVGVLGGGNLTVHRSVVGAVKGQDVELTQVVAGPMIAGGTVSLTQAGCGPVMTGGDLSIHQGGCGPVLARGNVTIEQGGCQSIVAGGGATLGRGSFVGAVLAPRVLVQDGARVLMSTPQAVALGAAFGLVFGLFARRRR